MKYYIGIDVGGTNIAAGLVDETYTLLNKQSILTKTGNGPEEICDCMNSLARQIVQEAKVDFSEVEWVGVGIPGTVHEKTGEIQFTNNLGFDGIDIKGMLEERFGCPVYLGNDANAAAYGEAIAGAGVGKKHILVLTLGTGVGGCYISEGKIFAGGDDLGGEFGHMGIVYGGEPCTCGRRGCLEAYASATALIRMTRETMEKTRDSLLWEIAGDLESVEGKTVFDAEKLGDAAAHEVVNRYIQYLAYGIAGYVNVFAPELVIIGGGISKQGKHFAQRILKAVEKELYNGCMIPEIVCAALGNDAGIIGAAMLGKD